MEKRRYFMYVADDDNDEYGWVYVCYEGATETDTELELFNEYCTTQRFEMYEKSKVKEITAEEYLEMCEVMQESDNEKIESTINKIMTRVKNDSQE